MTSDVNSGVAGTVSMDKKYVIVLTTAISESVPFNDHG